MTLPYTNRSWISEGTIFGTEMDADLLNVSALVARRSFLSFMARWRGATQSQLPMASTHT